MTDQQQYPDRRAQRRSRCFKGGRIVLGNGQSTLACRIRNQSETGVRMMLDEAYLIPATFTLLRGGQAGGFDTQTCRLAWRKDGEAGAEVVTSHPQASLKARAPRSPVTTTGRYPV